MRQWSHQQPPIEEQSTKEDSSSTDMLATNNQMSEQGIQTNVTFVQESQAPVNEAKPLDDNKLVLKFISPIPSPKEEKPKSRKVLCGNKGNKAKPSLEEVSLTAEILEEINQSLEEYK